jgi:hypothetical protein
MDNNLSASKIIEGGASGGSRGLNARERGNRLGVKPRFTDWVILSSGQKHH